MTQQVSPLSLGTIPVTYTVEDRVGVLTIDNPPVNASSAAVRAGLMSGLEVAEADDEVDAIVLIGASANFVSGSDLREFSGPVPEPQLPSVIAAIEASAKPVVAALSGATLGGGFELALGCDGRIALAGGVVGLPEITLGMIPGAGGTQRPLRLVGPARTLELVTSGERLPVEQAHREGLIDEVVTGSLRAQAIRFARALRGKRILRNLPVRGADPGEVEQVATTALRRAARPQTVAAVGAILMGGSAPADRAFQHERAEFNRLRNGTESSALRHLFFARRAALKANRPALPRELKSVGVVGAGTMGAGIARAFVEAGVPVVLVDQQRQAAAAAAERLQRTYQGMVTRGRLTESDAQHHLSLLTAGTTIRDLEETDLVVEAVYEDLEVKQTVLRQLETVLRPHVPLATNTSYLDVNEIAAAVARPTRVLGMHFFSPAHRAAVLEIVRGEKTSTEALDVALTAAKVLEKMPILAGVCDGFIGNRIYNAYRRQCELMLEEGALPQQVDAALTEFGFAMGPLAVSDMSGLDIAWRMRKSKAGARDPRERYPDVADALCELGRFGQKTGDGWYHYEPGSRTPHPDSTVEALIEQSSQRKAITRAAFTSQGIVTRALVTMANEAALLLVDKIADRPSDIDLMLTLGYGFPTHEGGITHWVGRQDRRFLEHELDALAARTGHGFTKGELDLLRS
ncbi:3-hydroxyacyl-CoA dehydrogenase NAD-binding domain-containing protein [Rhodococcus opacus]|uniref:3-hydroxyacyl-CoA dehydrogenase NAD-binding domain-containing protein n=1 Tax=Rhodococcus opacus TaxID=37919 RepID=UPI0007CD9B67|nr:3-hydroxyacyl-CoA dehydrogenase NAD-binding domain-containing protein [Rhodococcus opacus]MDX5964441.1 3-hydroxyacyl-CoA dehydrogenase NAD-binding domain-containing protein [Rhodococcus opacus]NKY72770.1 crotonase [Rhodococcus opacus]CAG7627892.1 Fatty acid oxidation complex subunit alpha [Rhodococcus opacus]